MVQDVESVIKTTKLTKVFRDFWLREKVTAVADLDMEIYPREVFGLLGPNGSGKSTTLKMILGLLFPTRGRVAVFQRRPTDVRVKARIGFLPEETYLYPFLNAHETLDYYGRLFRQPRRQRRRRVGMLLDMVGLQRVAYRRIGEYSKGMQRRIGLAQALINDPDLLILDEPTNGMDPIGTRQIKDLIVTLAARGKTVLLSSHLLADVEDVCNRVCVLYGGRVRRTGDVRELLAQRNRTQITTDRLDDETLERIRQIVVAAGGDTFGVDTPRDKLEDLFLRIVQEAQEQRLATGGAITGQVAEFLRAAPEEGRRIIEQLVSRTQVLPKPEKLTQPSEAAQAAEKEAAEVLHGLLGDKTDKTAQQAAPTPQPHEDRTDRGVIDKLTGGDKPKEEDA